MQISRKRGHRPPTSVGIKKTKMINLSCDIKISTVCSTVSSQSTRVTDRQTDGQNYDPQDRASIAASRCKMCGKFVHILLGNFVVFLAVKEFENRSTSGKVIVKM